MLVKHRTLNAVVDKKEQHNKTKQKLSGPHDPKCVSHRFHDHECVLHDLTLSNSILQPLQSIQES
jgi:hypothetical protein